MAVSQLTLIVAFAMATVGSFVVISRDESTEKGLMIRVVGGAFVVLLWGTVAFWANGYLVHSMCCTKQVSNSSLSALSAVAGIIILIDVVKLALGAISGGVE